MSYYVGMKERGRTKERESDVKKKAGKIVSTHIAYELLGEMQHAAKALPPERQVGEYSQIARMQKEVGIFPPPEVRESLCGVALGMDDPSNRANALVKVGYMVELDRKAAKEIFGTAFTMTKEIPSLPEKREAKLSLYTSIACAFAKIDAGAQLDEVVTEIESFPPHEAATALISIVKSKSRSLNGDFSLERNSHHRVQARALLVKAYETLEREGIFSEERNPFGFFAVTHVVSDLARGFMDIGDYPAAREVITGVDSPEEKFSLLAQLAGLSAESGSYTHAEALIEEISQGITRTMKDESLRGTFSVARLQQYKEGGLKLVSCAQSMRGDVENALETISQMQCGQHKDFALETSLGSLHKSKQKKEGRLGEKIQLLEQGIGLLFATQSETTIATGLACASHSLSNTETTIHEEEAEIMRKKLQETIAVVTPKVLSLSSVKEKSRALCSLAESELALTGSSSLLLQGEHLSQEQGNSGFDWGALAKVELLAGNFDETLVSYESVPPDARQNAFTALVKARPLDNATLNNIFYPILDATDSRKRENLFVALIKAEQEQGMDCSETLAKMRRHISEMDDTNTGKVFARRNVANLSVSNGIPVGEIQLLDEETKEQLRRSGVAGIETALDVLG